MNSKVDLYLLEGCGRCSLGGTPHCKVHKWPKELKLLRRLLLDCGLTEDLKWDVPTYTFQKNNIVILAALKDYCSLSFFKGALLSDEDQLLTKPGEHTQAARLIKFTDVREIIKHESSIRNYIFEAIEIEKLGLKVPVKNVSDYEISAEFEMILKKMPELKKAFNALTPGRQKAYLLHFSDAKQSKTREARVQKWIPHILKGKGFLEK